MSTAKDLWDAAPDHGKKGGVRSVNAMRFFALARMLAEAETAWLTDNNAQSMERASRTPGTLREDDCGAGRRPSD
jgi:hypothetical protein